MKSGALLSDTTVVILAGGAGTRFGEASAQRTPKCLLPLGDETIIRRLVTQLDDAGYSNVTVYCAPDDLLGFEDVLGRNPSIHAELRAKQRHTISIVSNTDCQQGPIVALIGSLQKLNTGACLLVLGDLVFAENPFFSVPHCSACEDPTSSRYIYLGVAKRPSHYEIRYGRVFSEKGVLRIEERPRTPYFGGMQWSGIALFSRELILRHNPASQWRVRSREVPLGELFNSSATYAALKTFNVPHFVNVNTRLDYYAAMKLVSGSEARDV